MQELVASRLKELCDEWRNKRPALNSPRWRQLKDNIQLNAAILKELTGKVPDSILFLDEPCGTDKLQ